MKCKCDICVELLLPLAKTIWIQFDVMCHQWIVVMYYLDSRGCTVRTELMTCTTIHTRLFTMENQSHCILRSRTAKEGFKSQCHQWSSSNTPCLKNTRVQGRTLFQLGGNEAATPISSKDNRGLHVGPRGLRDSLILIS